MQDVVVSLALYCSVVRTWLEIADRVGVLDGTRALRAGTELLSEKCDRFRLSVLRFEEDLSKRMAQEDDESGKELAASRAHGEEEEYSLAAAAAPPPAPGETWGRGVGWKRGIWVGGRGTWTRLPAEVVGRMVAAQCGRRAYGLSACGTGRVFLDSFPFHAAPFKRCASACI